MIVAPFKLMGLLIVALIVAALVDYCIRHSPIDLSLVQSSDTRLQAEVELFQSTFSRTFLVVDLRWMAIAVRYWIERFEIALAQLDMPNMRFLHRFQVTMVASVQAMLSTIEVFAIRCLALAAILLLIAIACVIAGIDGFVRREVRKAGAGFESARIYHFAKRSLQPILMWTCFFYLIVPIALDVRWVYGILAVTLPVLVGIAVSRFKKYV